MREGAIFYICPICFHLSETADVEHMHPMVHCPAFAPGDARLKPPMSAEGLLKSHAPQWFLAAVRELAHSS